MTAGRKPQSPIADPIRPMSWLDWHEDVDGFAGGDYRIRLLEPFRWEVSRAGRHVLFHETRSGAMDEAETHYREGLRRRDMWVFGLIALLAGTAVLLAIAFVPLDDLWRVLLFALLVHVVLSSLGRFVAAATRNRLDPYRRRAPWEPRSWWRG